MDLFAHAGQESPENQPLAERMRPRRLEDMLGQSKILGPQAPWRKLVESGQIPSLILWGPPGTGKTTFALLLAQKVDAEFIVVNAVETGAKALRELGDEGRRRRLERRRKTLLFVDEIHRLNKGQQDVLLPFVEKGDLILVGATTENPSYEINSALLSRSRILVFERLGEKELLSLAKRAADERGLTLESLLEADAIDRLLEFSDGDGRRLLNLMELLINLYSTSNEMPVLTASTEEIEFSDDDKSDDEPRDFDAIFAGTALAGKAPSREPAKDFVKQGPPEMKEAAKAAADFDEMAQREIPLPPSWPLSAEALANVLDAPALRYDKSADEHYDTISAFIKSVRGSDPDAAMYYLARMIKGGESPVFIARRLVILASEDIGNADPRAITLAVSGLQAVELVGFPEAAISLAQVTTYLASAPKSNRAYVALQNAQALVEKTGTLPVPLALRSAKGASMKELGYGKGYKYSHEGEKGYQKQRFLPEELGDVSIYEPTDHGFEKTFANT